MLIKYQALSNHLQKGLSPLYFLTGQDIYFLEQAAQQIRKAFLTQFDGEVKKVTLQTNQDWHLLADEANSFSLFHERVFLDCFYDKKSLDAEGKKWIESYSKSPNSKTLILLRAYEVPAKQLQVYANQAAITVVQIHALSTEEKRNWIAQQFKKANLQFNSTIPDMILNFTQGNMLACFQAVSKIIIVSHESIAESDVLFHLSDQCNYQLYDLSDACLHGDAAKAIHVIQKAMVNHSEATLVLWMLTQELRILSALKQGLLQQHPTSELIAKLKIWPQKASHYLSMEKRLSNNQLIVLFNLAKTIDEDIKTGKTRQIQSLLERIALALCTGDTSLCEV